MVLSVGWAHAKVCVSGSIVVVTVPLPVVERTSASSLATTGSMVDVWPFFAASAIRSTVPPAYWNFPCSESGLMIVRLAVFVPGELIHS